jgi:hypothetical protein
MANIDVKNLGGETVGSFELLGGREALPGGYAAGYGSNQEP